MSLQLGDTAPDFTAETTKVKLISMIFSATTGALFFLIPRITRRFALPN